MSLGRHSGFRKLLGLGALLGAVGMGSAVAVTQTKSPEPVTIGQGSAQLIGDPWRNSGSKTKRASQGKGHLNIGLGRSQASRKRSRRRAQRRRASA